MSGSGSGDSFSMQLSIGGANWLDRFFAALAHAVRR